MRSACRSPRVGSSAAGAHGEAAAYFCYERGVTRLYFDLPEDAPQLGPYRRALAGRSGDRVYFASTSEAERTARVREAEVIVAGQNIDALLPHAANVRWAAFWNAGIDHVLSPALEQRMREGLIVTNASGMHGAQMAEHAMAMVLAFTRAMPHFWREQSKGRWQREPSIGGVVDELAGKRMGIVGMGHIGRALARRAEAFDVLVRGLRSNHTSAELDDVLAESDHLVVLAPLTPQTHHLIDAGRLARMKPTAYLYNLARGPVVDEDALIEVLRERRIAGAGLDVFEREPLPADSPLWQLSNVILTPHAGGATPHYFERAAQLFLANLERFERGAPLEQMHQPERGY